ncbi:MAG: hypothetical protein ACOYMF_05600 [Bacteroidales bacterium]
MELVYDRRIADLVEKQFVEWYGIQWDTSVTSPVCTRIGDSQLHKHLPVQSLMKGCVLNDAGAVVYYLNPYDWTKKMDGTASKLDGTDGQVMVELPAHYRRFDSPTATLRQCKISLYALTGFTYVPSKYIGAYEAALQRSTSKLCSVVNLATDYRGGDNNATRDALASTFLGKAATSISRTNYRTYARNRGSVNWNLLTYDSYKSMFWLYFIEYANLNSQTAVNTAKDANGYAQGGLGNGVTDMNGTEWSNFNGYNPFVPCGFTNTLGNFSGELTYTAIDFGGAGANRTTKPNRYRGIENPFGHVWKWIDGVNIEFQSAAAGGLSKLWTCSLPANFTDANYANYTYLGNLSRANDYIKEMLAGEIMPSAQGAGAGSSTYWSDYAYMANIPDSGTDLRGVIFGGSANYGAAAGLGYSISNNAPSFTDPAVGSRLCFLGA